MTIRRDVGNRYLRRPHILRTSDPRWCITRLRIQCFRVRLWIPGRGMVHIGYRATLSEAQELRDEKRRELGLESM